MSDIVEIITEEIPPHTDLINGLINADLSLRRAIAELIANAIDHHANNVHVTYNDATDAVIIVDDGWGPPNGLRNAIQIGRHISSKENPIGKYGVGLKDAACWLANVAEINVMTLRGEKQSMRVNWEELRDSGTWRFRFANFSTRISHGMTIRLSELRPHKVRYWRDVPKYVAELFSAAIDSGIVITVDGEAISAEPIPALEFFRSFEGEHGGLRFKGFAGVLKNRKDAPSGWDIRYGPQSIAVGYQKEGFSQKSSDGFYGRFEMLEGLRKWQVSRNKSDSTDLFDVLNCDQMQAVIKPIMAHIRERGETLKLQTTLNMTSDALTNMFKKTKAKVIEDEIEDAPRPNAPRTETTDEPGPRPVPDPDRVIVPRPRPLVPRSRRVQDNTSAIIDAVRRAETVAVGWQGEADTKRYGFFRLIATERGRALRVMIDSSSEFGKRVWENPHTVLHYAAICLAIHFGVQADVLGQMKLRIGEGEPAETKVAKDLSFLLECAELEQFFSTNGK